MDILIKFILFVSLKYFFLEQSFDSQRKNASPEKVFTSKLIQSFKDCYFVLNLPFRKGLFCKASNLTLNENMEKGKVIKVFNSHDFNFICRQAVFYVFSSKEHMRHYDIMNDIADVSV